MIRSQWAPTPLSQVQRSQPWGQGHWGEPSSSDASFQVPETSGVRGGRAAATPSSSLGRLGYPDGVGHGPRKAFPAAPAAALAAAVRTAGLEKTPAANSCWAFWKLAPVRRYKEWICREEGRVIAECSSHSCSTPTQLPLTTNQPAGLL